MGTLTTSNINPVAGTGLISLGSNVLMTEGQIVQTQYVRTDVRTTYTALNSGNGTELTQLRVSITPRAATSWIWIRFTIHYEVNQNTVFLVQENSSLIGYNLERGNVRHSGILTPLYDNDYSSTPQNSTINWFVKAGSTASRYYSPAIRSSETSQFTFALNRSVGSTGQNDYETGISYGIVREIYSRT